MKFLIATILTALLAYAAGLFSFLPWWTFAITSFIVALAIHQTPGRAFLSGFLGLFLLWGILAMIIDYGNNHILSQKVAGVLGVGSGALLILITAIVGGLVSGLAALTGCYTRRTG
ncbi:MAG: hypothetical protein JWN76_3551 [Chitinophagaceae bacterium]|nr:hypothetical protein [Chitinophagaceae bacterium]